MKQNISSSNNNSNTNTNNNNDSETNTPMNTISRPALSPTNSNATAPDDDDPEMDLDIEEFLKLLPPESSKETKSNLVLSKKKDGLFLDKFAWWKVTRAKNQGASMDAESVVDAAKSQQSLHHRQNSDRANRSMTDVIHNTKSDFS